MRALSLAAYAAVLSAVAQPTSAQDVVRSWRVGTTTICGFRQVGGHMERFVAEETGRGLTYDFAPTEAAWHAAWCDRDSSSPPPSADEIIAQVSKPRPSCAQLEATWASMSHAQRLEIASIRAAHHYDDGCKLTP